MYHSDEIQNNDNAAIIHVAFRSNFGSACNSLRGHRISPTQFAQLLDMQNPADSPSKFAALFRDVALDQNIADAIIARGYDTLTSFAFSLQDVPAVEQLISEVLVSREALGAPLHINEDNVHISPLAGKIRRLWDEAWREFTAGASASAGPGGPGGAGGCNGAPNQATNPWYDAPVQKLSWEIRLDLSKTFAANYPGELLDLDTKPGVKIWSQLYAMVCPGAQMKWMPWKSYVSEQQEADILKGRGSKSPKAELAQSFAWLFDEPIELGYEVESKHAVDLVLTIRRNLFALCGTAHLTTLKKSDKRLMFFFAKQAATKGMRLPTAAEAQEADQVVWAEVFRLANEQDWSLDDALHEVTVVRGEFRNLLQLRVFVPRSVESTSNFGKAKSQSWHTPSSWGQPFGKSGNSNRGKNELPGKWNAGGQGAGPAPDWGGVLAEKVGPSRDFPDGQPVCKRRQETRCTWQDCKFFHGCPVKSGNGVCGAGHLYHNCPLLRNARKGGKGKGKGKGKAKY